jgi:hypothetical protein
MKTFDIWLEDSRGRQFRRTNHYLINFDAVKMQYGRMILALANNGMVPGLQIRHFNH